MTQSEFIRTVIGNFYRDLITCLKPLNREEKISMLESLIAYLSGVYSHDPPIPNVYVGSFVFEADDFIRKEILQKYRDKAKPFLETNLRLYFEKEIESRNALLKKLKLDYSSITDEEYEYYVNVINTVLNTLTDHLLTQSFETATQTTEKQIITLIEEDEIPEGNFKSASKDYSRSRQVLLFYYLLKLLGKGRSDNSMRKNAQFAHVLFAWPIDNIDNSAIYRMLKKAPYLKQDKGLQKDLEFVKVQFELIDFPEGVLLVQKDIDSIKRS